MSQSLLAILIIFLFVTALLTLAFWFYSPTKANTESKFDKGYEISDLYLYDKIHNLRLDLDALYEKLKLYPKADSTPKIIEELDAGMNDVSYAFDSLTSNDVAQAIKAYVDAQAHLTNAQNLIKLLQK